VVIKSLRALLLLATFTSSSSASWEPAAALPGLPRHHPVTFTLDGYGYSATGSTTGTGVTDDFYRYDPIADSWETLPDFPGPDRSYSYGGVFNGKGYLGFGSGTSYLRDLWQYEPGTGMWTELAPCPGLGREHPAFVITDDGKIFVGMGGSSAGNLRDWWEYDIATNVWTQKADLPGPARHHPYYFNVGTVPYVGFGHGAGIFNDVYRFNRESNTWTAMTDFPGDGRVAGTQFTHDGLGYILSGENSSHAPFPTGEFWRYNHSDDTWTQMQPHPGSSRWAPGTFLIGDTLYMVGGRNTSGLQRDMWTYDMTQPVSVGEPALEAALAFAPFPNPIRAQELQLFDPSSELRSASVRLLNVSGRDIAVLPHSAGRIQLPRDLAAGKYFVVLSTLEGKNISRSITVLR